MAQIRSNGGLLFWFDQKFILIENLANMVAAFAIFLLMLLGVCQIVLRTSFDAPIAGYIDLVELSMAAMAFMGVAYCQRLGAHIRMELLIGKLRGRYLWFFETFGVLVALMIVGVLVWYSTGHFIRAYTLGDTTMDAEIPVWPSKLLVPIAFLIWFLRLSIQLFGCIRLFIDPEREPIGVVTAKDIADQAKDEIHEVMGDAPEKEVF